MNTATESVQPHDKLIASLRAAEAELLADLTAGARENNWELVDQLFDTLPHLHHALFHAEPVPPGPPGRAGGTPPPLDPPNDLDIPPQHWPALGGVEKAILIAETGVLEEMAKLAQTGEWSAVYEALPILERLDRARRGFTRTPEESSP